MNKRIQFAALILAVVGISTGFRYYFNVQKISARMTTKSAQKGATSMVQADIFYQSSGKMITHFFDPVEYYMINTAKGEISVYDPKKNTVKQQQNYLYSTETSQLYYFLQNKKTDLGLKTMGFVVNSTRFEEDLMITRWNVPPSMTKMLREVELVHRGSNPIYMKYVGKDGKNAKKVFYYNYTSLSGLDFPQTITQIDFVGKDSIVTKTTYSDIKVNQMVDDALLNYTIPPTAKVIH
jgi:outer membrane lipoprotein-sorting protein